MNGSATWIKRESPWQFFQKRLLQLLFIQCLGLDKLYREQCQSIRLNPTFFGPRTGVGRQAANCGVGFQCFTPHLCDPDTQSWKAMSTNGPRRQIGADSQDLPARNSVRNEPCVKVRQVR